MSDNLLIVFGGTTQSEPQTIFNNDELKNQSVDVLQFNFITTESRVIVYRLQDQSYQRVDLLTAEPGSILELRALKAKINDNLAGYGYEALRGDLEQIKRVIEDINWSSKNYSKNSDARGMTLEACNSFASASKSFITSFLSTVGSGYKNIFLLAHSRGCNLVISALARNCGQQDYKVDDNMLAGKLKRLVLLDPVSMNVDNDGEKIVNANSETIKDLSRYKNSGVEIHCVVKTEMSGFDYDSYVDRLVGTKMGQKADVQELSYQNLNAPNLQSIFVSLAHMKHEGMMEEQLRAGFKKYFEIISPENWREMYANDELIAIDSLKTSAALNRYISGEQSASNIAPQENDSVYRFFKTFEVNAVKSTLKDRRRAFVHCAAAKVAAL